MKTDIQLATISNFTSSFKTRRLGGGPRGRVRFVVEAPVATHAEAAAIEALAGATVTLSAETADLAWGAESQP